MYLASFCAPSSLDNPSYTRSSASHLELENNHWLLVQNLVEMLKPIKVLKVQICGLVDM